jgi:protein-tyrosine phosphatase
MSSRKRISPDFELQYTRIPITSERPPDFSDLSELMDVVMRSDSVDTPIVVNCQLGRGRSTLASVRPRRPPVIRRLRVCRFS